jgi:hypothetical protein
VSGYVALSLSLPGAIVTYFVTDSTTTSLPGNGIVGAMDLKRGRTIVP